MEEIEYNSKIYKGESLVTKIFKKRRQVLKVYKHNTLVYEWLGDVPEPPVISYEYQVADTFNDFDTSLNIPYAYSYNNKKWYVLNNLHQYEEYGIYQITDDINSITTYPNKLAVVGTTEYKYDNGWSVVGTYESGFGKIGELSMDWEGEFPVNFAFLKSDMELIDYLDLYIYSKKGDLRVSLYDINTLDGEYIISDYSQGYSRRGTITSDDTYIYFNAPDDCPFDSVLPTDVMWWQASIGVYGVSTVASVQYDNITYQIYNGVYYQSEDITPKGKNIIYNINGECFTYNGETYIHTDENPYFVFEKTDSTVFNLRKEWGIELIYDSNFNIINYSDLNANTVYYGVLNNSIIGIQGSSPDIKFSKCIIPNSVTSIGGYAFFHCSSLTSITIPNSVTSIGENAFNYCTSLTSIIIPNSVTSIGQVVFANCTSLTSVTIQNGVEEVGYTNFYNCTSLTNVYLPKTIRIILNAAFRKCTHLTSITYDGTISQWGNITKYDLWKDEVPTTCVVHCTDGDIPISNA